MPDVEEIKSADGEQPRNNSFSMTAPVIGMGMSRSYSPESLLKSIKGLLATGLLEGLSVTYKNNGVEMVGRIHQLGYLCGCPICNYSTVLSAHKFEKHLGQSSNNQNDHIFLDSGITLYSVLQALKYTRLHLLGDMIEERIGRPPNLKQFEEWKSSFQVDNDEPDVDTFDPCSVQRTNSTPSGLDTVDGIEEPTVEEIKNEVGEQPRNNALSTTTPVKGLRALRKVNPESVLENVRGLLATGLLEGLSVTYKNNGVEMVGRIHQLGYLCGCPICSYSKVLSAREFEKHLGESSNNQNDHIFLDSGITLYSVMQALKYTRLHLLGDMIEETISLPPNVKQFEEWKSSFQMGNDESDVNAYDPCSMQRCPPEPTMEEIKNEVGEQLRNNEISTSTPVKGLTTLRKVNPESVLKDVRGLLATRLLEGFSVTYKWNGVEMSGTIDQQGYRCGCSCCNYSNVLNACEFENHSGELSSNQNDHIFLDSGISLYRVVQALKGTRLHMLGDMIEEKIGSSPNRKQFEEWKASFQADSDDSDVAAYDPRSIESTISLQESIAGEASDPPLATSLAGEYSPNDWSAFTKGHSERQFKQGNSNSTSTLGVRSEKGIANPSSGSFIETSIEKTPSGNSSDPLITNGDNPNYSPGPVKVIPTVSLPDLTANPAFTVPVPVTVIQDPLLHHNIYPNLRGLPAHKVRDDSLHQLIFKEGGLPDGTPLMYKSNGEVLITGHKRGTCIVCTCHNIEFSPLQFECHAGKGEKRQPYRSIYAPEGLTLHELSVKLHRDMQLNGGGSVISSTIHERPEPNHSEHMDRYESNGADIRSSTRRIRRRRAPSDPGASTSAPPPTPAPAPSQDLPVQQLLASLSADVASLRQFVEISVGGLYTRVGDLSTCVDQIAEELTLIRPQIGDLYLSGYSRRVRQRTNGGQDVVPAAQEDPYPHPSAPPLPQAD